MKKVVFAVLIGFLLSSCTGPKGATGDQGPAGPEIPGLYFIRILQQGVHSATYAGQTQAALWSGQSNSVYTDSINPINIGTTNILARYRSIIKFDLSSLPSSKIIVDKAELTIKTNANNYGGGALDVTTHRVTSSWLVYQAGWQNNTDSSSWTLPGGDFSANTITPSALSYNFPPSSTITIPLDPAVVQDWMLNPSTNYGMFFRVTDESSANYSEIYSSGAALASNRPMLKVWYYTTE